MAMTDDENQTLFEAKVHLGEIFSRLRELSEEELVRVKASRREAIESAMASVLLKATKDGNRVEVEEKLARRFR